MESTMFMSQIHLDLCHPWKDEDDYDKFITQYRLDLRKGIDANEKAGVINNALANELKAICDKIDIIFFTH
jgi:hypothetical protein